MKEGNYIYCFQYLFSFHLYTVGSTFISYNILSTISHLAIVTTRSGNVLPWDPFRLYCFRDFGTKTFEILFVMVVSSARLVN
jgi:hypothetical protein